MTTDGAAAAAAREPGVDSVGPAKAWIAERQARLDGFDAAARATLADGDCAGQAEGVRVAVGDFDGWIAEVSAAPDVVLSESLTSASLAVRGTVSACAGAKERMADQRSDLEAALVAVRARRERITSA